MQARAHTNEDRLVPEFIAHVNGAGDGLEARDANREGFTRLRSQLQIYPASARHASVVFESAATTARNLAAPCLPLGIAVAMHLYPVVRQYSNYRANQSRRRALLVRTKRSAVR